MAGIVLAGGKGRRLGQDKALLRVGGGPPLVALVVERLRGLVDEVLVVGDDGSRLGVLPARMVPDLYPGAGPLGGVYSGLCATEHRRALVVGCDMPFLNPDLLSYLLGLPADYDVLLPRRESGFLEPLHAIYAQNCREVFRRELEVGRYSAIGYLDRVRVRYVDEPELRALDPDLRSFFNVNTPEDLRLALEMNSSPPEKRSER